MRIEGKGVILTDDPRDSGKDFFKWFNLEEWQYFDRPDQPFQPISQEKFDQRAKKNEERYTKNKQDKSRPISGFHIDTVDDQYIGWVSIYNWDPEARSVFIGIAIPEEEHWGKGYGTEAIRLFLTYLFDSFGLNKVQAATWTGNQGMVRCAQKAGFTQYELMPHRSATSIRGEPLERIEFSLSREEWEKSKEDEG